MLEEMAAGCAGVRAGPDPGERGARLRLPAHRRAVLAAVTGARVVAGDAALRRR
jgi:hypothetical protein